MNRSRTNLFYYTLIVFAIFTSLATIMFIQDTLLSEFSGRSSRKSGDYWRGFFGWNTWVLTVPLAWWIVKKHTVDRVKHWKLVLYFLAITVVVIIYKAFALEALSHYTPFGRGRPDHHYFVDVFFSILSPRSFMETVIFWFILAFAYALQYSQLLKDKEIRSTQLESQLAYAQLDALKMQLQPHFLFNTLNSISTLLREKAEPNQLQENMADADSMITNLGEMFRHTLRIADVQMVPLRDELHFLDHYTAIEKMRFTDKLTIEKHIDPNVNSIEVPPYFLQPIVENAIRHGISKESKPGMVRIIIQKKEEKIHITIQDTGSCTAKELESVQENGVGLLNTKKRLTHLYGKDFSFSLHKNKDGETEVHIVIPAQKEIKDTVEGES